MRMLRPQAHLGMLLVVLEELHLQQALAEPAPEPLYFALGNRLVVQVVLFGRRFLLKADQASEYELARGVDKVQEVFEGLNADVGIVGDTQTGRPLTYLGAAGGEGDKADGEGVVEGVLDGEAGE